MTGFLPSRPARNHRAARNQARRLTEVGRLHQAHGEDRKELPSIYSEASKKEKGEKNFGTSTFFRANVFKKVTDRMFPFPWAEAPEAKLEPFTIRVKAAGPAVTLVGEIELIVGNGGGGRGADRSSWALTATCCRSF